MPYDGPMHAYRDPPRPPSDEEVAALAELARRVSSAKIRVVLPVLLLTIAGGAVAVGLHLAGHWSVAGRFDNGSYLINKGTIFVAMLVGAVAVAVPGVLLYRLVMGRVLSRWKVDARARYKIDADTADELARMFAPRSARGGGLVDSSP
jgi:hypothetical protein